MKNYIRYIIISLLAITVVSCNRKEKTQPERKNIQEAVFGNGFIEQEYQYIISSASNGMITNLRVSEGDNVASNITIANIKSDVQNSQLKDAEVVNKNAEKNAGNNSPELSQIKLQISMAREQLSLDKTNYLRYSNLKKQNSVSQLDLDKAELQYKNSLQNVQVLEQKYKQLNDEAKLDANRSKIQVNTQNEILGDYKISTANAGKVIEVYKKMGEWVRIGDPIAKIGSGNFLIKLYISEDDINKIMLGQKVIVHLNTYPNRNFEAKVSKILPGFNTSEQSYEIEAKFNTLPPNILSGTQLQANIETITRKNILVIPTSYIKKDKWITLENGEQREIKTGLKNNDWTEILSGITEKDVIIKKNK